MPVSPASCHFADDTTSVVVIHVCQGTLECYRILKRGILRVVGFGNLLSKIHLLSIEPIPQLMVVVFGAYQVAPVRLYLADGGLHGQFTVVPSHCSFHSILLINVKICGDGMRRCLVHLLSPPIVNCPIALPREGRMGCPVSWAIHKPGFFERAANFKPVCGIFFSAEIGVLRLRQLFGAIDKAVICLVDCHVSCNTDACFDTSADCVFVRGSQFRQCLAHCLCAALPSIDSFHDKILPIIVIVFVHVSRKRFTPLPGKARCTKSPRNCQTPYQTSSPSPRRFPVGHLGVHTDRHNTRRVLRTRDQQFCEHSGAHIRSLRLCGSSFPMREYRPRPSRVTCHAECQSYTLIHLHDIHECRQ